jgi:hypothetical protein
MVIPTIFTTFEIDLIAIPLTNNIFLPSKQTIIRKVKVITSGVEPAIFRRVA